MKRDKKLIDSMLLLIEESEDAPPLSLNAEYFLSLNENMAVISLHMELLADMGLVILSGVPWSKFRSIVRLTMKGYDYIDRLKIAMQPRKPVVFEIRD